MARRTVSVKVCDACKKDWTPGGKYGITELAPGKKAKPKDICKSCSDKIAALIMGDDVPGAAPIELQPSEFSSTQPSLDPNENVSFNSSDVRVG
jgi:hypothetical protein